MTGCEIIERINSYHDRASRRGLSFNMAVNDRLTAAIDRFGSRRKQFLTFGMAAHILPSALFTNCALPEVKSEVYAPPGFSSILSFNTREVSQLSKLLKAGIKTARIAKKPIKSKSKFYDHYYKKRKY